MKLNDKQIEFMSEDLCIKLVQILMQEWHYSMKEALTCYTTQKRLNASTILLPDFITKVSAMCTSI